MTITIEDLMRELEKTRAVQEIRNTLMYYKMQDQTVSPWEFINRSWADREDDTFEATWGRYEGKLAVAACYVEDHGDCTSPKLQRAVAEAAAKGGHLGGTLIIHHHTTDRIIVAEDGQTAQATFFAIGQETFGELSCDDPAEAGVGNWTCIHYGCDFIKTRVGWRIWHQWLLPGGMTSFGYSWAEEDPNITSWGELPWELVNAKPCIHQPWKYGREKTYPVNYPPTPERYATFADIAPGYGFEIQ